MKENPNVEHEYNAYTKILEGTKMKIKQPEY